MASGTSRVKGRTRDQLYEEAKNIYNDVSDRPGWVERGYDWVAEKLWREKTSQLNRVIAALIVTQRLEFVEGRGLRHEGLEPLDAFRALTVQHPALGPPEKIIRMQVRLAVPHVPPTYCAQPEAMGQLASRDIAPSLRDRALIAALVDHNWLAVCTAPVAHLLYV